MGKTVAEIEALFPGLETKKEAIRQAIIAQGVNVPQSALISTYATYIAQIVHIVDSVTITSATTLSPNYNQNTYTITFTTAGTSNWTIASNQSWCTFNTSSGSTTGNHSVTLTVAKNGSAGSAARSATITITCGTATGTISVNQAMNTADISITYLQNGSFTQGTQGTQYFILPVTNANLNSNYRVEIDMSMRWLGSTATTPSTLIQSWFIGTQGDTTYEINHVQGTGIKVVQKSQYDKGLYVTTIADDVELGGYRWHSSGSYIIYRDQRNTSYYRATLTITKGNINYMNETVGAGSGYTQISDTNKLIFFAGPSATKKAMSGSIRLYNIKVYDTSGTLVNNYTPVRHYNNGSYVPCLKDSVNNTYLYNSGSGTFTYN